MMLKQSVLKLSAFALVAGVLALSSCKEEEDERFTLRDTADLSEEALTDAYFQDMDDMAGVAIETPTDTEYNSGRTSGTITIHDHRFECEGVVVTVESDPSSTVEIPKGVLTIDFGTSGCHDLKGNSRTGKLIFTYNGKRFMPGSTVVTTTDNYFINGVKIEGTRTLTNQSTSTSDAPRFNVVLANGKATFADGLSATRQSNITWQWNRAENPLDDNLQIESTSTASGITRGGREYAVMLLEDLVYKRHCGIAVDGIKKYTINAEKEITIDFGDGTCDRTFTVTTNGATRTISL
jgi:hypothetical protein